MKELEVYIHIPFCAKKCSYCDFLSAPADGRTKRLYVEALQKEIRLSYYKFKGYVVDSIFIGGGTPSVLFGSQIEAILKTLRTYANVSEKAEITIECNPGTVTEDKLLSYKKAGINRISFGLQSADDNELKYLGRIHTYDDFKESFLLARKCGFDNINVDLMSAIPFQTFDSYSQTLKKVVECNPEHISSYSLIVEQDTPIEKLVESGEYKLPDEDTERKMYYYTEEFLNENGYKRYEISNYAKEGRECRHNIGYWQRREYLGFGIGAASLFKGERYNNTDDLYCYMNSLYYEETQENIYDNFGEYDLYSSDEQDAEGNNFNCTDETDMCYDTDEWNEKRLAEIESVKQKLTRKDEMEEFMFLGLRMTKGISKTKFESTFGCDYDTVFGNVTSALKDKKLLVCEGDAVRLTKLGVDLSNKVLSEFLL